MLIWWKFKGQGNFVLLPEPLRPLLAVWGLTHWGWDKMVTIFQTTFSNAFSWMKINKCWLRFQWSLFSRAQLSIFPYWFRQWLGAVQATSHYLNQWLLVYWRIYTSLGLNELSNIWSAQYGICSKKALLKRCQAQENTSENISHERVMLV